ncbi:LacI family DNA-binding transcriptional regulator [Rhizosaccharibacter radicis]|uniref:LacI family DNA-binding transcriptional regulator n=1 Tax=Rhizosaccharibacter radicis TaxID=2782605 RepID=A0ABT1VYM6_9PROT|nr:LacI family DNA-binding transcriptional regulator [Acetobacteraceae bacterium KSS12]
MHPHPLKDIARQAGVGLATVDRVVNGRGGVRPQTARRVAQAIAELEQQTLEATLHGRRFTIDLVMDAPLRFSDAVRGALDGLLPSLLPAVLRVRHHLSERAEPGEIAAVLRAIARRGSHGVILKAPNHPITAAAIDALRGRRIPTVTLVTDVAASARVAYVGMDNRAAGETAAFLIAAWLGARPDGAGGGVLVALSSHRFLGEEEREAGFRAALARDAPAVTVTGLAEARGLDRETRALALDVLEAAPSVRAVYSIGGGNAAILSAFDALKRPCDVFVGHDLDADNRALLRSRRLQAVLHHDLARDLREACLAILRDNRALPPGPAPSLSACAVITPFNLPEE